MRRVFTFLLILQFGLGPLSVLLPANAESRLPACCRRDGAHHCAMSGGVNAGPVKTLPRSTSVLTVPSHCDHFPSSMAAFVTPVHALTAPAVRLPILPAESETPAARQAAPRWIQIRTRAGRAPPSSSRMTIPSNAALLLDGQA